MKEGLGVLIGALGSEAIRQATKKKDAKEMAKIQEESARRMAEQNHRLAIETWEKTGAPAQVEQLRKANLNTGLMYSGSGGMGTASGQAGNAGNQQATGIDLSEGMGMMLQKTRQEAEIKNIEANTKKQEVETEQMGGIDAETKAANLENLKITTGKLGLDKQYQEYENAIKQIDANIANETQGDIVYKIKAESQKLIDQAREQNVNANVAEGTETEVINQINAASQEQALRMQIQKVTGDNLKMQSEEIKSKIAKINKEVTRYEWEMQNGNRETALKVRQTIVNELANDFLYGDEAKALRLFNAQREVVNWLGGTKTQPYNKESKNKPKSPNGREFKRQMGRMGR